MKHLFLFLIIIGGSIPLIAQNTTIIWQPTWGNENLELEKKYKAENDEIEITQLRCYISHIQLFKNDNLVFSEENSFHLLDAEDSSSLTQKMALPSPISFNKIRFCLGIDSLTQIQGVKGGDLDPTNGMYWTWQSGYIHLKLEGKSKLSPQRNKGFIYHLGGYSAPFNTVQTIELAVNQNDNILIKMDVLAFLKQQDISKVNHIMSPSQMAVTLSQQAIKMFKY